MIAHGRWITSISNNSPSHNTSIMFQSCKGGIRCVDWLYLLQLISHSSEITLQQIQSIYATREAFAALKQDGSVVTWGMVARGGYSSSVRNHLQQVKSIYATRHAFAALKQDGTVVTWGHADYGGDSSSVSDQLQQIKGVSWIWSRLFSFKC